MIMAEERKWVGHTVAGLMERRRCLKRGWSCGCVILYCLDVAVNDKTMLTWSDPAGKNLTGQFYLCRYITTNGEVVYLHWTIHKWWENLIVHLFCKPDMILKLSKHSYFFCENRESCKMKKNKSESSESITAWAHIEWPCSGEALLLIVRQAFVLPLS